MIPCKNSEWNPHPNPLPRVMRERDLYSERCATNFRRLNGFVGSGCSATAAGRRRKDRFVLGGPVAIVGRRMTIKDSARRLRFEVTARCGR